MTGPRSGLWGLSRVHVRNMHVDRATLDERRQGVADLLVEARHRGALRQHHRHQYSVVIDSHTDDTTAGQVRDHESRSALVQSGDRWTGERDRGDRVDVQGCVCGHGG